MSKQSRSKAQVARDKRGLKKLSSSGLYAGKVDYRKAPTSYQKRLLKRHADVIAGKAAVVRPKNPEAYRGIFKTQGDKVIVPKARGERIALSKTGRITRKKPGKKPRTIVPAKRAALPKPRPGRSYAFLLPFKRGSGDGATTEWRRFSHKGLVAFFAAYRVTPKALSSWLRYVEVEQVDAAYERELDRYETGQDIDGPSHAVERTSGARKAKRALRRDALAELDAEDDQEDDE